MHHHKKKKKLFKPMGAFYCSKHKNLRMFSLLTTITSLPLLLLISATSNVHSISISSADFERFIKPCYLGSGGGGGYNNDFAGSSLYQSPYASGAISSYSNGLQASASGYQQASTNVIGAPVASGTFGRGSALNGANPSPYYSGDQTNGAGRLMNQNNQQQVPLTSSYIGSNGPNGAAAFLSQGRDNLLGQAVPRANTIDNFISLVSKIEIANPRLAEDHDQLIRSLLSRFHLDNYYYDVRTRNPVGDQNLRDTHILPALLSGQQAPQLQQSGLPYQQLNAAEMVLDQNEKCSMYFMLSHFIEKLSSSSPSGAYSSSSPPLGQMPVQQLAGPQYGQRPPNLQAAGAGYPGQSAQAVYSGSSGSSPTGRYPGPTPGFGSPATSNMNAFGSGISNTNSDLGASKTPYGVNTPSNTQAQYNSLLSTSNLRNPNAAFPGAGVRAPYLDGSRSSVGGANSRSPDDRVAIEHGVVTLPNQDNAAFVLNRVLLGLLAANAPIQSLRQLASFIYPTQSLTQTPKLDEEIDPLYAVTLADLWAVGSIPKPGKPFEFRLMGDNGHWNDTMCPVSFKLERSSYNKFTTAELLGGLDGFNLGMLRRTMSSMRKRLRLSEMLRIYYSKKGFRPHYGEFGVCQRGMPLTQQFENLHRQAENYLRLYQLSSPMTDQDVAQMIGRLESFRDYARQAAQQFVPQEMCQESQSDFNPMTAQDQCEISRADVVTVLDTSPQANTPFMQLTVSKLAQKLGLSRDTNSFTIMTNQQDTTGYAGAYSFNSIVRNSTNLGEIGCALVHDTSSTYQGGQVTDPTRLMEMFERALVNLDSEYLTRQQIGGLFGSGSSSSSSYGNNNNRQSSFVSTWFNGQGGEVGALSGQYTPGGSSGGPRNTGGAKVVVWFNYGQQTRPGSSISGPTNWTPGHPYNSGSSSSSYDQPEYKFYEAKKYLRENFRGASILVVSPNRDEVKAFVYDEERDIFNDIPAASGSSLGSQNTADFYPPAQGDPNTMSMLAGPADSLTSKLLQRMCTIPALFQYPMCFRMPSSNEVSVGYISPGRKQYWMMSPKTFFASKSVRLVFRVEGGRLRVCFGRKPNPDETALRNQQQQQQIYQPAAAPASISFSQSQSQQQQPSMTTTPPPQSSDSDYYTGLEYGVCKDVGLNQEIDFMISDPCWHKSIAECEPFYFVVREISQPGEDPNYMCRDPACRQLDQAKFFMSHTGVTCSAASQRQAPPAWLLLMSISILSLWNASSGFSSSSFQWSKVNLKRPQLVKSMLACGLLMFAYLMSTIPQAVKAQQQAGVYDFGQNRYGEKRGNLTPSEVLAIILIVMLNLAGLALTIGLCFYITKRAKQRGQHTAVSQDEY